MLASKCFKLLLRPGQRAARVLLRKMLALHTLYESRHEYSRKSGIRPDGWLTVCQTPRTARFYDFAHLTGGLPCANLDGELNMYVGGTNGESRCKAGAVPQLYS